jgi:hypothetical protein
MGHLMHRFIEERDKNVVRKDESTQRAKIHGEPHIEIKNIYLSS